MTKSALELISRVMEPNIWLAIDRGLVKPRVAELQLARAAEVFAAIREPTTEQALAGHRAYYEHTGGSISIAMPGAQIVWRAMVDEALK